MSKKVVVLFACDICKATEEGEHSIHADLTKDAPLPKGWVRLIGNSTDGTVLDVELCPDCMKAIKDAIYEES